MSQATTNDDGETRKAIAKREWLNDKGERVPTGSPDVYAARYTFLGTGNSAEWKWGENEQLDRQFAAMGAVTKMGNVVNSFKDDDDYVDGADPIPAVLAWLKAAGAGEWREPGDGTVRGPKYDKDVLASVIVQVLGAQASGDVMSYRQRLDDKSYYAKVRTKTKIMAAYHAEMNKRGQGDEATLDDVA